MQRIQLPDTPFSGRNMTDFYEHILAQAGIAWPDDMTIDCTKINMSRDIQDMAYDAFIRATSAHESECNMVWALSGPKVDKDLPPHTVVLNEGFLFNRENQQDTLHDQNQDDDSLDL